MIVTSDEDSQRHEEDPEKKRDRLFLLVGEGGVEHEAGRVNHRQLIYELHGVY